MCIWYNNLILLAAWVNLAGGTRLSMRLWPCGSCKQRHPILLHAEVIISCSSGFSTRSLSCSSPLREYGVCVSDLGQDLGWVSNPSPCKSADFASYQIFKRSPKKLRCPKYFWTRGHENQKPTWAAIWARNSGKSGLISGW